MEDWSHPTLFEQKKEPNRDKAEGVKLDVLSQDGKTFKRTKNEKEKALKHGLKIATYYGIL